MIDELDFFLNAVLALNILLNNNGALKDRVGGNGWTIHFILEIYHHYVIAFICMYLSP